MHPERGGDFDWTDPQILHESPRPYFSPASATRSPKPLRIYGHARSASGPISYGEVRLPGFRPSRRGPLHLPRVRPGRHLILSVWEASRKAPGVRRRVFCVHLATAPGLMSEVGCCTRLTAHRHRRFAHPCHNPPQEPSTSPRRAGRFPCSDPRARYEPSHVRSGTAPYFLEPSS
jgi:hypothetical protein